MTVQALAPAALKLEPETFTKFPRPLVLAANIGGEPHAIQLPERVGKQRPHDRGTAPIRRINRNRHVNIVTVEILAVIGEHDPANENRRVAPYNAKSGIVLERMPVFSKVRNAGLDEGGDNIVSPIQNRTD